MILSLAGVGIGVDPDGVVWLKGWSVGAARQPDSKWYRAADVRAYDKNDRRLKAVVEVEKYVGLTGHAPPALEDDDPLMWQWADAPGMTRRDLRARLTT